MSGWGACDMTPDFNLGDTQLIIDACVKAGLSGPQIAYVLATAYWETARTMRPVEEAYYLGARADAYRKGLRYWPWYGRGYVQLTWRENYLKAGAAIGEDLTGNPNIALVPHIAAKILVQGMAQGWFTGKKLADYIGPGRVDYINARRIVNGTDKATEIAAIARDYEVALVVMSPGPVQPPLPAWLTALLDWLRNLWRQL